ncbi:MAG: response regulator [Flavobacteriia bacterium]|nr:response regulator [Flavobacteriia bacterium]
MELVKILIVEDDLSFANLVIHQLEMLNFDTDEILIVSSLQEAKLSKNEFEPEVVLLDLSISDSSGINTYDEINKLYELASIIILSGLNDKDLALQIVAKGAQDYVLKTEINSQLLDKTIRYGILRRTFRIGIYNSEKKYRDVFNRSPLPVLRLIDDSLTIVMANPAALKLYEAEIEDMIGKSMYSFNFYQDQRIDINTTSNFIKKRLKQKTIKGGEIINEIVINKLENEDGAYIALVIDRTEELKFEKQKFDVITQAEEREKKKIARELHDGLGQQLVLLNLLFQNITPKQEEEAQFNDISSLLQSSIRSIKEIAYALNPPELEHGFLNAIDRFANRIDSIGEIKFIVKIQKGIDEKSLDKVDRINLFRVIQELINNTLKHSQATEMTFVMEKSSDQIFISLEDNGIGFDIETAQTGMGMQNIQYRMKMSNIKCEYNSKIGKGVKVRMTINS